MTGSYDRPPKDYPDLPLQQPRPGRRHRTSLMIGVVVVVLAGLLAVLLAAGSAAARPGAMACAPYQLMLAQLEQRFGETPQARGLSTDGKPVTITVSAGRKWSILMTSSAGFACLVAHGTGWDQNDLGSMAEEPA